MRVGCVVRHRQRDLLAGPTQPLPLGVVAAPAGGQDQAKTFFRCQAGVVLGNGRGVHGSLLSTSGGAWRVMARNRLRQLSSNPSAETGDGTSQPASRSRDCKA